MTMETDDDENTGNDNDDNSKNGFRRTLKTSKFRYSNLYKIIVFGPAWGGGDSVRADPKKISYQVDKKNNHPAQPRQPPASAAASHTSTATPNPAPMSMAVHVAQNTHT